MRRFLSFLALSLLSLPLFASHTHGLNVNISTDDDEPLTRCDQIRASVDGERLPMSEETLDARGVRTLTVRTSQNGGVYVTAADDGVYSVKACKAAAFADAGSIRTAISGGTVTADGPDRSDWVVYFLVRAPRNASLDLTAHNGPISVHDVNGTITAHTQNGPLSLKNTTGTVDASAVNGPVSFAGDSGDVKLRVENGPLSVKLSSDFWGTGSLDAATENGPLSLKLPQNYRSGVVVETDGNGPVSCKAVACHGVRAFRDDGQEDRPRRFELGTGSMVVHLSTTNGPLSIKERD
ncbi:MAG TPA: hypothetical protein VH087_06580 [Thermoanaerobaculia bacterium]|nr:hypothetical protein [Thermoanaerobaculia bacterium]